MSMNAAIYQGEHEGAVEATKESRLEIPNGTSDDTTAAYTPWSTLGAYDGRTREGETPP